MPDTQSCHNCDVLRAEARGLREVIRSQGEFIQRIKREITTYTTSDTQRLMKRTKRLDK